MGTDPSASLRAKRSNPLHQAKQDGLLGRLARSDDVEGVRLPGCRSIVARMSAATCGTAAPDIAALIRATAACLRLQPEIGLPHIRIDPDVRRAALHQHAARLQ